MRIPLPKNIAFGDAVEIQKKLGAASIVIDNGRGYLEFTTTPNLFIQYEHVAIAREMQFQLRRYLEATHNNPLDQRTADLLQRWETLHERTNREYH